MQGTRSESVKPPFAHVDDIGVTSHLAGYVLEGPIWPGSGVQLHAARRETDRTDVLIRVADRDPLTLAALERQRAIRDAVTSSGCLRVLDLVMDATRVGLVFERFSGVALDDYARDHVPGSEDFLVLALSLTRTFREIHEGGVLTGPLGPSQVVIDPLDRRVRIWDMSSARFLGEPVAYLQPLGAACASLFAAAPEHTERTGATAGPWSDLYSLGCILYQLATGRAIFEGGAIDVVQQILTRDPAPAHELNPTLPVTLSRLIAKLVAKHPRDRYASARILELDLIECRAQLARYGSIDEALPLGATEPEGRSRAAGATATPGRVDAIDPLRSALREVRDRVRAGGCELTILKSPPGSGKCSLLHHFLSEPESLGCRVLRGIYSSESAALPHDGLRQAIEMLLRQLNIEQRSLMILEDPTLNGLGGALVQWVPELAAILQIGGQPLPRLQPRRALNRLGTALEVMARQLPSEEVPLVWMLEHVDRVGSEGLDLIAALLRSPATRHAWVVATCDVESESAELPRRIQNLIDDLVRLDVRVEVLERSGAAPPVASVHVAGASPPLEFFDELEPEAVAFFADAAICGLTFNDRDLAVLGYAHAEIVRHATAALKLGVLQLCSDGLRFSRPELRRRALEGRTAEQRTETHRRLATAVDRWATDARCVGGAYGFAAGIDVSISIDLDHKGVFARAWHYLGCAQTLGAAERGEALESILAAANAAIDLGVSRTARYFAEQGAELHATRVAAGGSGSLGDSRSGRAAFELAMLQLESDLALGSIQSAFERLKQLYDELDATARTRGDRMRLELMRLRLVHRQDGSMAFVHAAAAALRSLGLREPVRPRSARLHWIRRSVSRKLAEVDPEMFERREREHAGEVELTDVLDSLLSMASWLAPPFGFCVAARRIQLSLARGSAASPAKALAVFARSLSLLFGDYAAAARIAQLALQVDARWPAPLESPRTQLSVHLLSLAWVSQRRRILEPLERVAEGARKVGDFDAAALAYLGGAIAAFVSGEPLSNVDRRLRSVVSRLDRMHHPMCRVAAGCQREVRRLIDGGDASGASDDARAARGDVSEAAVDRAIVGTFALVASYFADGVEGLYERAAELRPLDWEGLPLFPHVSECLLYTGVTAASALPDARYTRRRKPLQLLNDCERRLTALAVHGPDNFEHQSLLLQAEQMRTRGESQRAMALYARAADRAHAQGHRNHAALALERRASLALEVGFVAEGAGLLHEAIAMLQEWGARHAARTLHDRHQSLLSVYPRLLLRESPRERGGEVSAIRTTTQSGETTAATLDLATVLRSSEAISGEVELERVIERVLAITIENGGAQRGVLLLEHEGELLLEAERDVASAAKRYDPPLGMQAAGSLVPSNLVQYVQRTRRSVVLNDAATEGLFVDDPYVVASRISSILCLPIMRQGRLVGALYLENASVSDAFNSSRVEVLRMLSSHAAISLDNARLYSQLTSLNRDLEARIEERTEKLREARDAAEAATQAKSEFLAVMSHEIRTPMNVVIGMAQIMMDLNLTSDQKDCVRAIHTAGDSLLNVINDILDFSKIEVGKLELEHVPFELRSCLEDVAEILAPKAYSKGLEFPVLVARSVANALIGDPNRLKQVIINFVNNAIKFTDEGSVSIRVETCEAQSDRVRLRFEVQDTGIGIPKDRLSRLFQSFSQVDASTTRKYGGTGLGLVISKRLVEGMNGVVGVDSVEGEGSTFWFEAVFGLADTAAHARAREVARESLDLSSAHALILSQASDAAHALAEQIAYLGAEADRVSDVGAAEEKLASAQGSTTPYRVVFLRYPLEDPAYADWMQAQQRHPERLLCLLSTLAERGSLEREPEDVDWLMRPVKQASLKRVLAHSIGVHLADDTADVARLPEPVREARARRTILVAEDYPLNRKLAAFMLSRAGYGFEMVNDGRQALEALAHKHYDLVLMDCQMPELDGFTAAREIRRREAFSEHHVPIVAMTANAMKGDRERCLEAGMDDYLSKPIQLEALDAVLTRYLPDDELDDGSPSADGSPASPA